jgi:hypothetical protein
MKKLAGRIVFCWGLGLLGFSEAHATVYTIDDSAGSGQSATVSGGAVFQQFQNGSGSGVYTRMFALQTQGNNTFSTGYNDNVASPFDQKNGVGTPATQIAQIPLVNIGGTDYLQLLVDFGSESQATVSQLKVWTNASGNVNQSTFSGLSTALGTPLYDIGADSVQFTNIPSGSGYSNMAFYIPYALFPIDHTQYVYVWLNFTGEGGGGYDEIAYNKGLVGVGTTPEAHTVWGGVLMGALLFGGYFKRRFQKPTQAS